MVAELARRAEIKLLYKVYEYESERNRDGEVTRARKDEDGVHDDRAEA